jgi:protein-tyrosine phosphatase
MPGSDLAILPDGPVLVIADWPNMVMPLAEGIGSMRSISNFPGRAGVVSYLTAAMLLMTLGALQPATAHPGSAIVVERRSPLQVALDWHGLADGTPVSVFVATTPDAKGAARHLLVRDDRDGAETVSLAAPGRPYFWIKPRGGKGEWAAERLLPLEGGHNFRDLGGYRTASGRKVRWGKLYRSAAMSGLTAGDYAYLGKLGIRSVCDFRSTSERKSGPNLWVDDAKISYWTRDYALSASNSGAILSSLASGKATPELMRDVMLTTYRDFPEAQKPAYTEMFAQLVDGKLPLAFNCTAGKDRTGLGAALVLTALGVPFETIKADYLLSNRYLDASAIKADKSLSMMMSRLSPEVAAPLVGVEAAYLDAAFAEINKRYGSVDAYLSDGLGLDKKRRALLRKRLLE